jgi:class 3 adenylate cyclase/predicted RNA-binding Zn-ribbon protein involved in translation (DUF1610 family)
MEIKINEKLLDEKLGELEKARQWSPRTVSKLETLIRSGDDFSLFRINSLTYAVEKNTPENEAIDLFLYSSKLGLFETNWHLICPTCGDSVESFRTMRSLHSDYRCTICSVDTHASLDDYIVVTFTISERIREIAPHKPDVLTIEDLVFKYHFNREALMPDGTNAIDAVRESVKGLSYILPGEKKSFEFDVPNGFVEIYDFTSSEVFMLGVVGNPKSEIQRISIKFNGKFELQTNEIPPGKVDFEVENLSNKRMAFILVNIPDLVKHKYGNPYNTLTLKPFLSGKKLITTQAFRDLYRNEVIQSNEGIGVKDITILFTDLKGSTALYDRIGDLKAFNLVRQHFDSLGKVINKYSGAIVKTIGDAVMATFLNPIDAVNASIEMLREIEDFNKGLASKNIILKIGIHKGHAIVVTLNDSLDYFGQNVNIASRVQGLADAEEIYITDDIYNYPGVRDLLKDFNIVPDKARLKGVQEEMKVYRITDKMREETKVSEVKSVAKAKRLKGREAKVINKRKKKVAV